MDDTDNNDDNTGDPTRLSLPTLDRILLNIMDHTKPNTTPKNSVTNITTTDTITTNDNPSSSSPSPLPTNTTTYHASFQQDPETDIVDGMNHHTGGTIALEVQNITWQQEPIEHPTTLHRILREYHKVNSSTDCTLPMIEVLPTTQQWEEQNLDQYEPQILKSKFNKVIPLPTFVNSWIGDRKKTMVYINKDETLLTRVLPPPSRAAERHYPAACDSLQHTTGLYLYAPKTTAQDKDASDMTDTRIIPLNYPTLNHPDENVWECVRFLSYNRG
jgi:hypothetical protein